MDLSSRHLYFSTTSVIVTLSAFKQPPGEVISNFCSYWKSRLSGEKIKRKNKNRIFLKLNAEVLAIYAPSLTGFLISEGWIVFLVVVSWVVS